MIKEGFLTFLSIILVLGFFALKWKLATTKMTGIMIIVAAFIFMATTPAQAE